MITEMTLELHHPFTEEELDALMDVDMEHTPSVAFMTKHGKVVEYVRAAPPMLLTLEQAQRYCGAAWVESIWDADEESPEGDHDLYEAAVYHGALLCEHGVTERERLAEMYNKRNGMRLWTGRPSDEQMKGAAWDG